MEIFDKLNWFERFVWFWKLGNRTTFVRKIKQNEWNSFHGEVPNDTMIFRAISGENLMAGFRKYRLMPDLPARIATVRAAQADARIATIRRLVRHTVILKKVLEPNLMKASLFSHGNTIQ